MAKKIEYSPRKIISDSIRFHNLNPLGQTVSFITLDFEQVVNIPTGKNSSTIKSEISRSKAIWFQDLPQHQDQLRVLEVIIPPLERSVRKIISERKELEE